MNEEQWAEALADRFFADLKRHVIYIKNDEDKRTFWHVLYERIEKELI